MSKRTTQPVLVALLLTISIAVVVSTASTQAQAPQTDKPVEQTRKNIQVLKGLPESQLFLVMNFMAVSLGENCTFCHVTNGKDPKTGSTIWVWDSDQKPEKQAGRRMLQMVLMINGSNKVEFTRNSVTCFTCHQGRRTTVGLPAMPLAQSGHEKAPVSSSTLTPRPRPSVEEIIGRYIQAVGGANASATKTLFMKGTRVASQNRSVANEITVSLPDKVQIVVTTPQGRMRQILAGDNGWILSGTNLRTLTATEAANARRGLEAVFEVVKVTHAPGMQIAGVEKIDGRDMWVVVASSPERTVTYDFDAESGLLRRERTVNHTFALPIPEQIDFEDYRDVDGVKLPFTIRSSAIDTFDSWTRTFTEIKRNVAADDSVFAKPTLPK